MMTSPCQLMRRIRVGLRNLFALGALIVTAACTAKPADTMIEVPVSGVNYTEQGFSYIFQDPNNDQIGAGGESVDPYSGGGTMCCYPLPKNWHPGLKTKVKLYDEHRMFVKDVLADIPPYPDGNPGQLWAALYPDGSVEAISSNFSPPHANWPGKIKGWPRPSIAYQRMLWQREVEEVKGVLRNSNFLLSDPATSAELRGIAQKNLEHYTLYLRELEAHRP